MKRRVPIDAASLTPLSPTFDIFLRSIFTGMLLAPFLFRTRVPICTRLAASARQSSNDAYISRALIATFLRDLLQQFHANFAWARGV